MGIIERAQEKLQRNLTGIENRSDLSNDEKAAHIIKLFAATCAGIACQPIPFADFFILTPIQIFMGSRIAAVRGVPVTRSKVEEVLREIAGAVGMGLLAQQLIIGAYKTFIPFLGFVTTVPLVFGATFAIGKVMDSYFKAKAMNQSLSKETIQAIWRSALKDGRREGKQQESQIRSDAKRERDTLDESNRT